MNRKLRQDATEVTAMSDASSSAKRTPLERLRSFANDILEHQTGSLDGCDIQEIATRHGLLEKLEMEEPCGESCECAMLADFPLECYRRTALLLPETGVLPDEKLLTPNDIHERLIARLKDAQRPTHLTPQRETILAAFDMAIDTVRRKCPNCADQGFTMELSPPIEPTQIIRVTCSCNRPAQLADWEKRLNA